jgi:hypothetical protein
VSFTAQLDMIKTNKTAGMKDLGLPFIMFLSLHEYKQTIIDQVRKCEHLFGFND